MTPETAQYEISHLDSSSQHIRNPLHPILPQSLVCPECLKSAGTSNALEPGAKAHFGSHYGNSTAMKLSSSGYDLSGITRSCSAVSRVLKVVCQILSS